MNAFSLHVSPQLKQSWTYDLKPLPLSLKEQSLTRLELIEVLEAAGTNHFNNRAELSGSLIHTYVWNLTHDALLPLPQTPLPRCSVRVARITYLISTCHTMAIRTPTARLCTKTSQPYCARHPWDVSSARCSGP